MKTKIALAVITLSLVGCYIPPYTPVEKPEVQARRGELNVQLQKSRGEWANDCITKDIIPVAFDSDRPAKCFIVAKGIFPDTITDQLMFEFKGNIYVEAKQ